MIKVALLHYELEQAGIIISGCDSNGIVFDIDGNQIQTRPDVRAVIDAHDPNGLLPWEQDEQTAQAQKIAFRELPEWATWTPVEARDNIKSRVLNGQTTAQVEAWIDANITGTTVAALKAQTIAALKIMAGGLITLRDIVSMMGYAIMLLRDVVIRRTG